MTVSPSLSDVVEPKTVGQGRMSGKHRFGDLDGRLGAAGSGGDAHPTAVDQPETLGIFDADAQCSVGVAFAPGRVAEYVVGGVGAPLADR